MVDEAGLTRAIEGLNAGAATRVAASHRYRAALERAADHLERADWHTSIADALDGTSSASLVIVASSRLPDRDLTRLIFDAESSIADFESHCGGELLGWNRAILAILRRSLASRRALASRSMAEIAGN